MKRRHRYGHYPMGTRNGPGSPSQRVQRWGIVSYDRRLLCERISLSLHRKPSTSLRELSQELRVSRRTIQNTVITIQGKKFRDLRNELLLENVEKLLASAPNATIRQVSLEAGYKSPRSFARAVRRACGVSPQQLRSRISGHLLSHKD